jgi:hypothetical protein
MDGSPTALPATTSWGVPVVPSPEVRDELAGALHADETLLGEIYRRLEDGESPAEIQAARGADRPNFVWSYNRAIRAWRDGDLPTAPSVSQGVARSFRRLLRTAALSPEAESVARENLAILNLRAADQTARIVEDQEAREKTAEAEAQAVPGIYVYALPHYLNFPFDPDSGHTLFKVGRSDRSVIQRFRDQTRTTALPEDPVLLRVYEAAGEDALRMEREFHDFLEAADHTRSTARTGGTEWFLTSLRFLDKIAASLGLKANLVYDSEAVE